MLDTWIVFSCHLWSHASSDHFIDYVDYIQENYKSITIWKIKFGPKYWFTLLVSVFLEFRVNLINFKRNNTMVFNYLLHLPTLLWTLLQSKEREF